MNLDEVYSKLTIKTDAKLVLVVLDGLGDIATREQSFVTPLEAARTPNLDALAKSGAQGRMIPVAPGITPGSGPGHLGLFGYDPLEFQVGRGVIEALGLGVELRAGDIAARANFCTINSKGIVTDRRAGRIETKVTEELCALLSRKIKKIGDAEVLVKPRQGPPFCRGVSRKGAGRAVDGRGPESRRTPRAGRASNRREVRQAKESGGTGGGNFSGRHCHCSPASIRPMGSF
jgi:2,3-bisphosphoglycerate-independent phosphoglycerate mutase